MFLPFECGTSTSFAYENAQDDDVLTFQIRAQEHNQNNIALFNLFNITVNPNRPMDFIHLTNLCVSDPVSGAQWSGAER